MNRYKTSHLEEDQYEPGSGGKVLRNLLKIKNKREMDRVETIALKQTEEAIFRFYDERHRFTSKDICEIHRIWLGRIYSWAGKYRTVNLAKGSFPFAAASHMNSLMMEFEKSSLKNNTPCISKNPQKTAKALAETHAELVLIHPFREGNGRVARLLATLMALQAGLPPLDFSLIRGKEKKAYFLAVQAALDKNYKPMEKIFESVIKKTMKLYGKRDR